MYRLSHSPRIIRKPYTIIQKSFLSFPSHRALGIFILYSCTCIICIRWRAAGPHTVPHEDHSLVARVYWLLYSVVRKHGQNNLKIRYLFTFFDLNYNQKSYFNIFSQAESFDNVNVERIRKKKKMKYYRIRLKIISVFFFHYEIDISIVYLFFQKNRNQFAYVIFSSIPILSKCAPIINIIVNNEK